MSAIRFSATKLLGRGKKGILTPDGNGYYTMPLGGLNAWNSAGQYYTLKGAEELFRSSSILMRRVSNGNLKGELGHPMPEKGMTENEYLNRVLTIKEGNVCIHIAELWLDREFGKNNPQYKNPDLVAVMGRISPSGPHAGHIARSIENPEENFNTSVRGITRDFYERGVCKRVLTTIVTYDVPTEPGINFANKWDSPALETIQDVLIKRRNLEEITKPETTYATESSKELALEALQNSYKAVELPRIPLYTKW